jgi:Secretion system C-terminal sorting domain
LADDCRDNSVITTSKMQLQHPHFDDALHITMSAQGFMSMTLDTSLSASYSYPATVYPNQTMQSGDTGSLYFVFMTFANDSLTIATNKTKDAGIKIYPTAATEFINVEIDEPMQPKLLIYNLNGQIVAQENNNFYQVDISHLSAGMYIVEIENGKYKYRQKIVKL